MDEPFVRIDRVAPTDLPVVLIAVLLSICYIAGILRVWARGYILRTLGWDDLAMLVALVSEVRVSLRNLD
jgi:hypothetical protein